MQWRKYIMVAARWALGSMVWDSITSGSVPLWIGRLVGAVAAIVLGVLGLSGDVPLWLVGVLVLFGLVAGIWLVNGVSYLYLRFRKKPVQLKSALEPQGEIRFSASDDADLEVFLVQKEVKLFRWKALLFEVKVEVRNRTPGSKRIERTTWEIGPPDSGQPRYYEDDVRRAVEELKRNRTQLEHIIIEPNDIVTGWIPVALPDQMSGGVGGFTLRIQDELGTEYVLRREQLGGYQETSS